MDWNAQVPGIVAILVTVVVLVLLLRFMLRLAGCLLVIGLGAFLLLHVARVSPRTDAAPDRHCPHLNTACVEAYRRTTWSRIEQSELVRRVRHALGLPPIPVHAPEDPRWVDGPLRTPGGHLDPSRQQRYRGHPTPRRRHHRRPPAAVDSIPAPQP